MIEYHITHINTSKGEYYESAKSLSEPFIENCKQNLGVYHVYWDISKFIGSKTTIEKNDDIKYEETPRERKLGNFSNAFKKWFLVVHNPWKINQVSNKI